MMYLIGTTAITEKVGRCKIRSILVTAGGADSQFIIHPYGLTSSPNDIIINVLSTTTVQVQFDGIPFDSGVIVDPDANCVKYVVEYEE